MATNKAQAAPEDQHAKLAANAAAAASVHARAATALASAKARIAAIDTELAADSARVRQIGLVQSQHDGIIAKKAEEVRQHADAMRAAQLAANFAAGVEGVESKAQAALDEVTAKHDTAAGELAEWTANAQTHRAGFDAERQEIAERRAQLEGERASLADEMPFFTTAVQQTREAARAAELEHIAARLDDVRQRKHLAEIQVAALSSDAEALSTRQIALNGKPQPWRADPISERGADAGDATAAAADLGDAVAQLVAALREGTAGGALLDARGDIFGAILPARYDRATVVQMFSHAPVEPIGSAGNVTPAELILAWSGAAHGLAGNPATAAIAAARVGVVQAIGRHLDDRTLLAFTGELLDALCPSALSAASLAELVAYGADAHEASARMLDGWQRAAQKLAEAPAKAAQEQADRLERIKSESAERRARIEASTAEEVRRRQWLTQPQSSSTGPVNLTAAEAAQRAQGGGR